jgi:hypothetical protein
MLKITPKHGGLNLQLFILFIIHYPKFGLDGCFAGPKLTLVSVVTWWIK